VKALTDRKEDEMKARFAVSALLLSLAATATTAKDLRTAMIRLVPETDWRPSPQAVAIVVENKAVHAESAQFTAEFEKWMRESLARLDFTVDDKAPTRVRFTIEELDPGNAGLRFAIGFGAGKSYVRGLVTVEEGGSPIARLQFTARPKGFSMNGMAKEVAPPLILKIKNGERDAELHEPNAKEEKPAQGGR
jgi:hypothetical protein